MDDAQMAKLVGESNVTMLKTLIDGRSTFEGYSQSLANTNTAYEQMAINNDNFEGAVTKLKSAWDALMITLGQSGVL
jgi:TP901 family phage tail tape measure protein